MMELLSSKANKIVIHRSQKEDLKNILDFHNNHVRFSSPGYLQDAVENYLGISLVAFKGGQLLGHLLIVPLSSQKNIGIEEAALICGVWSLDTGTSELLIREAVMCAWESGFHALFSFESNARLKKIGFIPVEKKYFAIDLSKHNVLGMELTWNGFKIITKDLILPVTYLPSVQKFNHFFNN